MIRIHVNSHIVRTNSKTGEVAPPLTIRRGSRIERAHSVQLIGSARVVYQPNKPLKCGAKIWIECEDAIGVINN